MNPNATTLSPIAYTYFANHFFKTLYLNTFCWHSGKTCWNYWWGTIFDRYLCDPWHIGVYFNKTFHQGIENLISNHESKGKKFANPFAKHYCKTRLLNMFARSSCLTVRHSGMTQFDRSFARHSRRTFLKVTFATSLPLRAVPKLLGNELAGQWCKDTLQRSNATMTPCY